MGKIRRIPLKLHFTPNTLDWVNISVLTGTHQKLIPVLDRNRKGGTKGLNERNNRRRSRFS